MSSAAVEAEYKEAKQEEVAEPAEEVYEAAPAPAMEDEKLLHQPC